MRLRQRPRQALRHNRLRASHSSSRICRIKAARGAAFLFVASLALLSQPVRDPATTWETVPRACVNCNVLLPSVRTCVSGAECRAEEVPLIPRWNSIVLRDLIADQEVHHGSFSCLIEID